MVNTKSILIVDDDETILAVLKEILELDGYTVETAATGKEAIEKSENILVNLSLLDIKLPDMEGTELITKLHKENPQMIRIITVSYTHLRAHETVLDLVCRLLLEKKKK